MNRSTALDRIRGHDDPWDVLVIGGGATGLGVAVDAASRGYDTLLVDQHDFAKGTSSRSTKLIHGGVRYLRQGHLRLVRESLRERGRLCRNAPHVVHEHGFILPCYRWWERSFYGVGLKVYDRMAGALGFKSSRRLSRQETLLQLPTLNPNGLRGGVLYFDGQFDDARLAINLARTVWDHGGCAVNYVRVHELIKAAGRVVGVVAEDAFSGECFDVRSRTVINATGVYADAVRRLDEPDASRIIVASRGTHIVLPRSFHPGDCAIMIPRTADGRLLFAVPWQGHVLIGTTDVPVEDTPLEPQPTETEVSYLLEHAGRYLVKAPGRDDVLSVFSGLRPLVKRGGAEPGNTSALSRDHTLLTSSSGLITITGGKWTTYRKMAEAAVDRAEQVAGWTTRSCRTHDLPIHGHTQDARLTGHWNVYGADALAVQALQQEQARWGQSLHPGLPYVAAEVIWAVRQEMACTLEDVLSRRLRALTLNSRAAKAMALDVSHLMAQELHWSDEMRDAQFASFLQVADSHTP